MAKITFDGIEVEVEDGTTILNAARKIGGKVVPPAMCYYTPLKGSGGKCRVCLVKVTQGSAKDPRPMPKLVASCVTPVQDGMVVENTLSPQVQEARKGVVEMLLINHPLDCPVCDKAFATSSKLKIHRATDKHKNKQAQADEDAEALRPSS